MKGKPGALTASVLMLCAAVFVGAGAVLAWFVATDRAGTADFGGQVTPGSEITMEMIVDGRPDTLTFEDAVPGRTYVCTLKFYNNTGAPALFDLDFLNIESQIKTETGAIDPNKSFLNVIGVKGFSVSEGKIVPDADFTCLAYRMKDSADKTNAKILSGIPINAYGDGGRPGTLSLTIEIKFLEEIRDEENKTMAGEINDFQEQSFRIGQIRVSKQA